MEIFDFMKTHILTGKNIYVTPNIPEKKIKNAIKNYAYTTCAEDVLVFIDNTVFGSGTESIILTKDYLIAKELCTDTTFFRITDINEISIIKKDLHINGTKIYMLAKGDALNNFMNFLGEYIKFYKHSYVTMTSNLQSNISSQGDSLPDVQKNESSLVDLCENSPAQSNVNTTNTLPSEYNEPHTYSASFFAIIAKMGGYAVLSVVLLKHNAPDKVLALVSRLPVVGTAGMLGRFVLGKPLDWLNEQIILHGEPFIMSKLSEDWKANGISYEELAETISNAPSFLFEEQDKTEALEMLQRYYCEGSNSLSYMPNHESMPQSGFTNVGMSIEQKITLIKELASLRDSGILTEEEFQKQKNKLFT